MEVLLLFPESEKSLLKPENPTQRGSVAQSVEQRTENPRVGGSIPSRTTILTLFAGVAQLVEQLTCNQ